MTGYTVNLAPAETDILTIPVTHGRGGAPVLLSEVESLVCTIRNGPGNVINGRRNQDVLNTNGGTYEDGEFTFWLVSADTTPLAGEEGVHTAVFTLVLVDGQERKFQIELRISPTPTD